MSQSTPPPTHQERNSLTVLLPPLIVAIGLLVFIAGLLLALVALIDGTSTVIVLIDLLLVGLPGGALMAVGYWLPRSDITARYYPRIIVWVVGGVVAMFGFILFRDFHPAVTVQWSVGTQSIALTIGSIGGLLIGIQETRATMRTEQLEDRTQELKAQEERLKRQNDRLEQFADLVSHDLRNPLNVAQGELELARNDCASEHLDEVERTHTRMQTLIEDLLMLARHGDAVTDPEQVSLDGIVQTCWTNVETGDARLHVDSDRTIRADEGRLKQLFENLIRNAVEHGGEDVTVTVGDLTDGFYVEDTGSGIPEAARAEVFDAGYSTSRDGTGFGLRIVKQVVDTHGWDIRVTDAADGGARFEITGVEPVG